MEQKFIEIFNGLKRDYGYADVSNGYKDTTTGKLRVKHAWAGKPITNIDYIQHLKGKKSIGVQPCDDEGMAQFGAIDIDPDYKNFDLRKYLKTIVNKKLPVIPVKSKSGGLHLYIFLKEKTKATAIRNFLDKLLYVLELESNTEIFPKQTELGKTENDTPINGNFINLPYYNKKERVAVNPHDGTEFTLEQFLQVVDANIKTASELEEFANSLVRDELTGGAEEFIDGPPCLQALTKNKLTDGRDRFLYNYMVFAKKKYPDNWDDKVLEAARNYFVYSSNWNDEKVKLKIKQWKKDTKGHTCSEDPIVNYCMKSVCIKRKFGITSDKKKSWPMLSNLTQIDYKPNPEYYFTVEKPGGETVQIHANHVNKLRDQRELKGVLMEQAHIVPPTIKNSEFFEIQTALFSRVDLIKPAEGTSQEEKLHEYLNEYVFQVLANSHTSFKNGATLMDDEYVYFVWGKFFNFLKNKEWKMKEDRTGVLMKTLYKIQDEDFVCRKRYPKKSGDKKSNPDVTCVKILKSYFKKEEYQDEVISMKDREDIL
ncbi:MAG: hypothetical protein CMI74_08885 [Candidatus Pelagibacter sp.]|nr:hypothetical protein [Candidatus Pelagibacter sp.]|tara:strand:- start:2127 stop:3743 length:1617 start_codon:yes stop_codon:yes gene_type:complete